MLRLAAFGLLALCTVVACSRESGGPSITGPVGEVTSVSGEVTATRPGAQGAMRALIVGAEVYADDTVATAAGSTVTIRLRHNHADWMLEGGKSQRVDRSVAWTAPRTGDGLTLGGDPDRTAAAGRHVEPSAVAEALAAPAAEEAKESDDDSRASAARPRHGKGGGADKLADPKPPGGRGAAPLERLAEGQIREGMESIMHKAQVCGGKHDGHGAKVVVEVTISAAGKVTAAQPLGDHAGKPLGKCVANAAKGARFPAALAPTTVRYPFELR